MLHHTQLRSRCILASLALIASRFTPAASAWQYPHPPVPAFGAGQHPIHSSSYEDVDIISMSQFSGLKTYANLPYLNCFSDEEAQGKAYDIAVMGAPFDTVRSYMPPGSYV